MNYKFNTEKWCYIEDDDGIFDIWFIRHNNTYIHHGSYLSVRFHFDRIKEYPSDQIEMFSMKEMNFNLNKVNQIVMDVLEYDKQILLKKDRYNE